MCCTDTLVDNLTVKEMLMYTAELKLPMSQSIEEKRERVKHIIELLALLPCQNRRIGNAMQRGISGGFQLLYKAMQIDANACMLSTKSSSDHQGDCTSNA